jgi:hypothetical protein
MVQMDDTRAESDLEYCNACGAKLPRTSGRELQLNLYFAGFARGSRCLKQMRNSVSPPGYRG